MKLIIVRHAEPDYSIDSLTPIGWEEALPSPPAFAKPTRNLTPPGIKKEPSDGGFFLYLFITATP